jgi:hypothetical protein
MKTKKKNIFQKLIWRLQFKKALFIPTKRDYLDLMEGRCTNCDAGNPRVECSEYYCPCNENEQLKRKKSLK